MNVLSLFDGMSCGQIALNRIGIKPSIYYASEIDKYAIKVTQANYPSTIQLGDIKKWQEWDIDWDSIDLVTGGFPCQAWSVAGKQLGDRDERGALFWTMLDVMKKVLKANPNAKFLMENVRMKKEFEEYITYHTEQALGKVEKHLINSSLVSAQNRKRFYWTNIEGIEQPEDKGILLKDIIDNDIVDREKAYCIDANYFKGTNLEQYLTKSRRQIVFKDKSGCLLATIYKENTKSMLKRKKIGFIISDVKKVKFRKLTPLECERLQTVPDGYTDHVSNTQRYKMLGNGWTVDVITHILKELK